MEGQTLIEKSEKMIEAILESYKEYPVTVRMDTEKNFAEFCFRDFLIPTA